MNKWPTVAAALAGVFTARRVALVIAAILLVAGVLHQDVVVLVGLGEAVELSESWCRRFLQLE